ncbi:MAG: hypothetical protein R3B93_25335 [Bacteroidia bacterium]
MKRYIICIIAGFMGLSAIAQKKMTPARASELAGIEFTGNVLRDTRLLSVASAKTLLEIEANPEGIEVEKVEVFSYPIPSGRLDDGRQWLDLLVSSLTRKGWDIGMGKDSSFTWLSNGTIRLLMFTSVNKREAAAYFGLLSESFLPSYDDLGTGAGRL